MAGIEIKRIRKSPSRWIAPFFGGFNITGATANPTAGRVYLLLFEVLTPCIVDRITISNGGTVAGNVTAGIYGPISTEETCNNSAVLVQSASTALSGTNAGQDITITDTVLNPGRYYVAVEFSDATHLYGRNNNQNVVTGSGQIYDRGGGYGALTNPCPAPTSTPTNMPLVRVRCKPLNT